MSLTLANYQIPGQDGRACHRHCLQLLSTRTRWKGMTLSPTIKFQDTLEGRGMALTLTLTSTYQDKMRGRGMALTLFPTIKYQWQQVMNPPWWEAHCLVKYFVCMPPNFSYPFKLSIILPKLHYWAIPLPPNLVVLFLLSLLLYEHCDSPLSIHKIVHDNCQTSASVPNPNFHMLVPHGHIHNKWLSACCPCSPNILRVIQTVHTILPKKSIVYLSSLYCLSDIVKHPLLYIQRRPSPSDSIICKVPISYYNCIVVHNNHNTESSSHNLPTLWSLQRKSFYFPIIDHKGATLTILQDETTQIHYSFYTCHFKSPHLQHWSSNIGHSEVKMSMFLYCWPFLSQAKNPLSLLQRGNPIVQRRELRNGWCQIGI